MNEYDNISFPQFLRLIGEERIAEMVEKGQFPDPSKTRKEFKPTPIPTPSVKQKPSGKFHIGQVVKNENGDVFLVKTNHAHGVVEVIEQPKTTQRFVYPESDLTAIVEYDNDDYEESPCDDCQLRFNCRH